MRLEVDWEQLFWTVTNPSQNVLQAGAGMMLVTTHLALGRIRVDISDDGPDLLDILRENPQALMRRQHIVKVDAGGTVFCIDLAETLSRQSLETGRQTMHVLCRAS